MVKQVAIVLGIGTFAGIICTGCIQEASEQEIEAMCENLVKIRGEVDMSSEAELIAQVKESFKKEEKRLRDWKARDLKGWDDELEAKLKEAKDDAEKAKLKEEYEKKKVVTASKHDPGIDGIGDKMKKSIESAKKKVVENQALYAKKVEECITSGKKEGVSQKVAQCRIKAENPDTYWNVCR